MLIIGVLWGITKNDAVDMLNNHCMKNHISFSRCSEKMVFPKNCIGTWSFLYHQERWYFFSPKIWYCSSGRNWKMIFLKKKQGNMINFSNVLKRWSFQNKLHWNMIFLVSWGKMAFLFPKTMIFLLRAEYERWSFSKNTWKYDVFCMLVKVLFLFPTNMKLPFCPKSKDNLFPKNTRTGDISGITEKDDIHPRKDDVDILDWHSRKSSNDSLYFYGDLFKCFHILLSNKKTPGNLTYNAEIWLDL